MVKSIVSDKDLGYKKFKSEMKKISKKPHTKIGIQGSDANKAKQVRNDDGSITEDSSLTVVAIGTFHEFGFGVPERSFLRATLDENREKYVSISNKLKTEIAIGKIDNQAALAIIGEKIKKDCQRRITDGIPPELEQATIDKKGSSTPLVDTGQLRASITFVVEAKE